MRARSKRNERMRPPVRVSVSSTKKGKRASRLPWFGGLISHIISLTAPMVEGLHPANSDFLMAKKNNFSLFCLVLAQKRLPSHLYEKINLII